MRRKILPLLSVCVLNFGLVACSNEENTKTEELSKEKYHIFLYILYEK